MLSLRPWDVKEYLGAVLVVHGVRMLTNDRAARGGVARLSMRTPRWNHRRMETAGGGGARYGWKEVRTWACPVPTRWYGACELRVGCTGRRQAAADGVKDNGIAASSRRDEKAVSSHRTPRAAGGCNSPANDEVATGQLAGPRDASQARQFFV